MENSLQIFFFLWKAVILNLGRKMSPSQDILFSNWLEYLASLT